MKFKLKLGNVQQDLQIQSLTEIGSNPHQSLSLDRLITTSEPQAINQLTHYLH